MPHGQDAVPVPVALHDQARALPEVRMGVHLAAVRLRNGTTVAPVIVNSRPEFLGVAHAADLDRWDPPKIAPDDVVEIVDASRYFD